MTATTATRRRRSKGQGAGAEAVLRPAWGRAGSVAQAKGPVQSERRAVILVRLRKAIYAGSTGEIPAGSVMRVESELHSRWQIEVSPIDQPGRRICVILGTEVEEIGPDVVWDTRTMRLLFMARRAMAVGQERLGRELWRRYYAHHRREGVLSMIGSRDSQIVPYTGGDR